MKRNHFCSALFCLILTTAFSIADDGRNQRLKELDQKISALKDERAKIVAKNATATAADAGMNSGVQGRLESRSADVVLFIEGDQSVGTGFIGSSGGKKYVYTTAGVLSGNTKLTIRNSAGTSFKKFGDLEAAENADLVRMEIMEEVKDSLELYPAQPSLQINQKIAALGAGDGDGMITVEEGLLLGTSAETLEVDAEKNKGNNGGPIVDIATGKVVGLLTRTSYGQDSVWSDGTRQGKARRFACRLDRDWVWKPMKVAKFLADGKALDDHLVLTTICYDIMSKLEIGCSYTIPSIGPKARNPIGSFPEHELVKAYVDFLADIKGGVRSPNAETKKKIRNLLAQVYSKAINSKDGLRSANQAWYHRIRIDRYIECREKCLKCVNLGLEEMR